MDHFWNGFEKRAAQVENAPDPEQPQEKPGLVLPTAQAAAGYGLVRSGMDPLTGRITLYHGTHPDKVNTIMREGLQPVHGGEGAAKISDLSRFQGRSKNKVHVTEAKPVAKMFRAYHLGHGKGHLLDPKTGLIPGNPKGLITMNLPMSQYENFKADPDMGGRKVLGATTEQAIEPKYIKGNKGYMANRFSEISREIPGYIKAHPGRFAAGVGLTGLGLYSGYRAARNLYDRMNHPGDTTTV